MRGQKTLKATANNLTPEDGWIEVTGAKEHNLRSINLRIPREKLVVITGISGSGKSSLAFDTIYAEGQRRYLETFSAYARQFLGGIERPDVEKIDGLSRGLDGRGHGRLRSPQGPGVAGTS